jgi:hypothetical protein
MRAGTTQCFLRVGNRRLNCERRISAAILEAARAGKTLRDYLSAARSVEAGGAL